MRLAELRRQAASFLGVGLFSAAFHYGALIALVELGGWGPVPATLAGFTAGGIVSYTLNRRLTYRSDRPHGEATWRFGVVAGIGFVLTGLLMHLFTTRLGLPYLPSQLVTTGVVLIWSFWGNRLWTFGRR